MTPPSSSFLGTDSPLPLSPSEQHLDPGQPIRRSGLDSSDLDPFVQSDSFVYLAVSPRHSSQADITMVTEVSKFDTHPDPTHTHLDPTHTHPDPPYTQSDHSHTQSDPKPTRLAPPHLEEGDFLSTDSFVYLAAPVCLLLGADGTAPYSTRYVFF